MGWQDWQIVPPAQTFRGKAHVADNSLQEVTIEVMGRRYPITTKLPPETIQELATYVDQTFRSATENSTGADTVGVAVLAALNIADQYFQALNTQPMTAENMTARIGAIEQLVDRALEDTSPPSGTDGQ